ncbi:LysM-like peptidoglycan-binding domain-containing protein [Dickeya chrysanthemi]|uniref:LysM-like peptidoglycan-binding domain-containing protein n=1 Tax=Dickeya chrysanthemi TaxID=556 RepID=UPI00039EB126|nr:LysM-like peptidoglycan-binding domain-containing protein [Dickeya chrysanthemi]MBX9446223.1 Opacity-associated protein A [Dickeya chrysanthemi]MCA7006630.1 Opacity-associated protein A [Dickeya chrysanthemi]
MGRIAPRRKQSAWNRLTLWQSCRNWLAQWRQRKAIPGEPEESADEAETVSPPPASRRRLRRQPSWLRTLWHLPDDFSWMEPLPYFHRRCILLLLCLLLLVLLWPVSPPAPMPSRQVEVPLSSTAPIQAQLVAPTATANQTPRPATSGPNWQSYQIASGQTLAQLFRDNNLPVSDVFAMAQVEGQSKPLSNLHAGQNVRLQLNTQGMVSQLEIDTPDGQQVQFARQQDGSFIRVR